MTFADARRAPRGHKESTMEIDQRAPIKAGGSLEIAAPAHDV
jgi:hypothetical protein